jgi:hypothetical protein
MLEGRELDWASPLESVIGSNRTELKRELLKLRSPMRHGNSLLPEFTPPFSGHKVGQHLLQPPALS